MFWYDGTPTGRPKPVAHASRFLSEHIVRVGDAVWTDSSAHHFELAAPPPDTVDPNNGIYAQFIFTGPGCYIVGAKSHASAGLNSTMDPRGSGLGIVMASWSPVAVATAVALAAAEGGAEGRAGQLGAPPVVHIMSTHDAHVYIDPAVLVTAARGTRSMYDSEQHHRVHHFRVQGVHGGADGSASTGRDAGRGGTLSTSNVVSLLLLAGEVVTITPHKEEQ